TYAGEIANTTVRANLIDPGAVATGMRAKAMPGEDPATLPRPEAIAEHFIPLAMSSCTKNGELINIPATR
ncbi:MAG: oxidoreductase, partial [Hyphomicrobiales bacterium]